MSHLANKSEVSTKKKEFKEKGCEKKQHLTRPIDCYFFFSSIDVCSELLESTQILKCGRIEIKIYEQETVEKYHNNNHTLKGSFETLAKKPTQRGLSLSFIVTGREESTTPEKITSKVNF
ncbi:uncharacterized protein LOC114961071 isoform X2 [Acropora millepora]|uniref:uncharacterized protein LOC114961071 isoform X2 n=1 Tax=Acropora millepora TaxID=45264 RepID=UPI0010FCB003|nr:uncharacterized protein LOC114961071 isoform X2 [Acropora millepora]